MTAPERLPAFAALDDAKRDRFLGALGRDELAPLKRRWEIWARPEQLPPPGDWRVWLICAGRGFGKTRAGAEWASAVARTDASARIALVGASMAETRAIMVEGESGILAVSPPNNEPLFEPSLRRISWPNGAQAFLYSAAEPEGLRGPQHSHACGAGAEGIRGKRGTCAHRRPAPLHSGRRGDQPASLAGRWRVLACVRQRLRRLGRAGRDSRLPPGRHLAVRSPDRGNASVQPAFGAGYALRRWLAGRS